MFSNFAWSEMLIIACVAIIVVGPKDLPAMLRTFGKTIGSIKRMAGDFQRQFNDAIREAELDEVKDLTSTKGFAPLEDAKKSMQEFAESMQDPVATETAPEPTKPEEKVEPAAKPAAKKPAPRKAAAKKTPAKATATKSSSSKSAPAKKPVAKKTAANTKRATKAPAKSAS